MTPDKLIKYRKGNFELKSKHIYAKQKLENIRDNILLSSNLVGGNLFKSATQKIDNKIEEEFIKKDRNTDIVFDDIAKLIIETMETNKNNLLINNDEEKVFKDLIKADTELTNVFNDYRNIDNQKYDNIDEADIIQKLLINIQKNLFKLQAKIIFSSLKKIKKANVTNLFTQINNKIELMNNYINKQEEKYNEKQDTSDAKATPEAKAILEDKGTPNYEDTPVAEDKDTPVAEDKDTPVAEDKDTSDAKDTPVVEAKTTADDKSLFYIDNYIYKYKLINEIIYNNDNYEHEVDKSIEQIEKEYEKHYKIDDSMGDGSLTIMKNKDKLDKKFIEIFNNMGFNDKYLLPLTISTTQVEIRDFYSITQAVTLELKNLYNTNKNDI